MTTPAVLAVVRNMVPADSLQTGSVIIERSDRGKVLRKAVVMGLGRCSDPGNVHYIVDVHAAGGTRTRALVWCYARCATLETERPQGRNVTCETTGKETE